MPVSVFELFKIGVGSSSSHTMGPMIAAGRFAEELAATGKLKQAVVTQAIRAAFVEPDESCVEMLTVPESNGLPGSGVLKQAADRAKIMRTGSEEQSILTFMQPQRVEGGHQTRRRS